MSSLCESRFYKSIADNINARVGRYTLIFLAFNAGMFSASTGMTIQCLLLEINPSEYLNVAFLPSSFSMYFVTLGWSFGLEPVNASPERTLRATLCFTIAAIVAWPFSILLALPFVFEELFVTGHAPRGQFAWRFGRLLKAVPVVVTVLAITVAVDSYVYGRFVLVPLNIITYNLLSSSGGPVLYGVEPWYFYILNGLLNFNVLLPLALLSPLALAITAYSTPKKFALTKPGQTSGSILMAIRLSPFCLWFGIITMQAHKEERFLFPVYPLICFQAAVVLGLARGWQEEVYVRVYNAPFNVCQTILTRIV